MIFHILPNGDLIIIANDTTRQILKDTEDYYSREALLREYARESGWDMPAPEQLGALTDAPIIVDDNHTTTDTGHYIVFEGARVWWYERYQLEDPTTILANTGSVVFSNALMETQ